MTRPNRARPILSSMAGRSSRPDAEIFKASFAIKDGLILAIGAQEAMPAARETLDASGLHILPGAIDAHVHFRDPGYPLKRRFRQRDGGGGVRRRDDGVRHAQHLADRRHARSARAKTHAITPPRRPMWITASTPCSARTAFPMWKPWSKVGSSASSSIWAILFGSHSDADDRGDAGGLRARGYHGGNASRAACGNQFDHDPAQIAPSRSGPHGAARPSRRAAGRRRRRSGGARSDPGRMVRRAHPYSAYLFRRGTPAARRGQSARRRCDGRDLPALPHAVERRLCTVWRRHPGQSPRARASQPGTALGGAEERRNRHDRDRSCAAFAGRKDPFRYLGRRLRVPGRRDADAANAHRDRRGPRHRARLCPLERREPPPRSGGCFRARAR